MKKLLLLMFTGIMCLSSCSLFNDFGDKVEINKSEVYYKDGATEAEAKRLAKYLVKAEWFDEETQRSVQLSKPEDIYVLRLVVDAEKMTDAARLTLWKFQYDISEDVFNKKRVEVRLADTKLADIEVLPPIARLRVPEKNTIYYNIGDFKKEYAQKLADVLVAKEYFTGDNPKDVLLTMEDNVPVIRFIVNKKLVMEEEEKYVPIYSYFLDIINNDVFEGEKSKGFLTSAVYQDFKKIPKLTADQKSLYENQTTQTTENILDSASTETTVSGVIRFKD